MMHLKGKIYSVWPTANGFSNFLWNKVISMESKSHLFWLTSQWSKPEKFSSQVSPGPGSSKVLISELLCLWTRSSPLLSTWLAATCFQKSSELTRLCRLKDNKSTERLLYFS